MLDGLIASKGVFFEVCNGKRKFPCRRDNDAYSFSLTLSHSFRRTSVCENPYYGDLLRPFASDLSRPYTPLNDTRCFPDMETVF